MVASLPCAAIGLLAFVSPNPRGELLIEPPRAGIHDSLRRDGVAVLAARAPRPHEENNDFRKGGPPPPLPAGPPEPAAPQRAKHRGGETTAAPPASNAKPAEKPAPEARRVRVVDEKGETLIARVHGDPRSRVVVLPDGQLGWPNALVFTEERFTPLSHEELRDRLAAGPYRGFDHLETRHYLVFYNSSKSFARSSAMLLESLLGGLSKAFRERGLNVRDPEFPLVAVVYRTESEFRASRQVAPDVQAYYDIISNRIFFYEMRTRELDPPELAGRRKPQTVAHEGTHQILNNIGIQPRLASWPIWLVEGLAEYCAPTETKRGQWAGFNKVNPFHMATLADLSDTLALQLQNPTASRTRIGRDPNAGQTMVEYIVTREKLSPTDYALAWSLTHYLANKRYREFIAYLNELSQLPPLSPRTPADHLKAFRAAFGENLVALDTRVGKHLANLKHEPLLFYAVTFEQPLGGGRVKRGALVSQSPLLIEQWLEETAAPNGVPYLWQAWPFVSRTAAFQAADEWFRRQ